MFKDHPSYLHDSKLNYKAALPVLAQQLFSLASLSWAKGLFVNQCKNKQDFKDMYFNYVM